MPDITFTMVPAGKGWKGTIYMAAQDGSGRVVAARGPVVTAETPQKAKAIATVKAANIAQQVLNNPVLASLMPPQAAIALKAAKMIGADAAVGKLASGVAKIGGPAAKRLGKVLGSIF